jgi:hypothetical protein
VSAEFTLLLVVNVIALMILTLVQMAAIPRRIVRNLTGRKMLETWVGMAFLGALALAPINLYVLWIHRTVVPLNVVSEVMSRYDSDPGEWRDGIEASRIDDAHWDWMARQGRDNESIRLAQSHLWHGWPTIVTIGLLIFAISLLALRIIHPPVVREIARDLYSSNLVSTRFKVNRRT